MASFEAKDRGLDVELPAGNPPGRKVSRKLDLSCNDACAPERFSAQATKDLPLGRGNAVDGRFSAACAIPRRML
jgi:hypothetical protein